MEETLEYWQETLAQFEEYLAQEEQMEVKQDDMIRLLHSEVSYCKQKIKELSTND